MPHTLDDQKTLEQAISYGPLSRIRIDNSIPTTPPTLDDNAADYYARIRLEAYLAKCPPLYHDTDTKRLPASLWATLADWQYSPIGIYLYGPSGCGKTRTAWLVIKAQMLQGRTVLYYDGTTWGASISKNYGNPDDTATWLNRLAKPDIVFVDDLWKSKVTEAYETAVYALLERRMAHRKPTIITTNVQEDELKKRLTQAGFEDRFLPMMRRIRQSCRMMHLRTCIELQKGDA